LEHYKREFERNYYGNRAPLGLYMHAGLLMAFSDHQVELNEFLEWALTHEHVWLVTISEVRGPEGRSLLAAPACALGAEPLLDSRADAALACSGTREAACVTTVNSQEVQPQASLDLINLHTFLYETTHQ
jgi:hypothetical protein